MRGRFQEKERMHFQRVPEKTKKNKQEVAGCVVRFYRIVLSWDYLKMQKQGENGDDNKLLREVKHIYRDVDEYHDTFEPLLLQELKAQILQHRNEDTRWQQGRISKYKGKVDGFHHPTVILPYSDSDSDSIFRNDLLLVSTRTLGEVSYFPTAYAFALVDSCYRGSAKLRLYLDGEIQIYNVNYVQPCFRLLQMLPVVRSKGGKLYVKKICNLSTLIREYIAIRCISFLPFKDLILRAESVTREANWELPKPLNKCMKRNHNKSQMEAILAGFSQNPFVLIQGPPGTGKTQTILGIMSAILHATPHAMQKENIQHIKEKRELCAIKYRPAYEENIQLIQEKMLRLWIPLVTPRALTVPTPSGSIGGCKDILRIEEKIIPKLLDPDTNYAGIDECKPISRIEEQFIPELVDPNTKYAVHVLVCAPSNSALDEIVLRVLTKGLHDQYGVSYHPDIVRVGLNEHPSVKSVSLDYLVELKLAQTSSNLKRRSKLARMKDKFRTSIVDNAAIVFSTLGYSGSYIFSKLKRDFDVIIIDEAAQAVESSTLIPLANGCKQVFLVGDPVQLPATVISPVAQKFGYGMSLFRRLQEAGHPVTMLNTQYRMHPKISVFPSREFYNGALLDGPDLDQSTKRPWHDSQILGPFCFFDIHDGRESQTSGSSSWINRDEVEFILALYEKLVAKYPELKMSSKLGVISPYKQQVKLLKEILPDTSVEMNTVDGFQGREKEITIFSCVRASRDRGIGFVSDFRRMNVGITRAKSSLLVVGSASTLRRDKHWKNLIQSAMQRNVLYKVSKPYRSFFSITT